MGWFGGGGPGGGAIHPVPVIGRWPWVLRRRALKHLDVVSRGVRE
jgi:hypothetical protein